MAQIALNYSAAQINAAIAKINSLVSVIEGNIVQLYDGTTAIYPRTKAEAVFFDNDTSKTLDQQFSQLEQNSKKTDGIFNGIIGEFSKNGLSAYQNFYVGTVPKGIKIINNSSIPILVAENRSLDNRQDISAGSSIIANSDKSLFRTLNISGDVVLSFILPIPNGAIVTDKIADNAIIPEKTSFISSINLVNKNDENVALGYYVSRYGGLVQHSDYNTTGFIRVEPNTKYQLTSSDFAIGARFVCCYNENKVCLNLDIQNVNQIETNKNTYYIRLSYSLGQWVHAQVTKGINPVLYTEYQLRLNEDIHTNVDTKKVSIDDIEGIAKEAINNATTKLGYTVEVNNVSTYTRLSNDLFSIPIPIGTKIKNNGIKIGFFDNNSLTTRKDLSNGQEWITTFEINFIRTLEVSGNVLLEIDTRNKLLDGTEIDGKLLKSFSTDINRLSFVKTGINIYDKDNDPNFAIGKYLNQWGQLKDNSSYNTSGFIKVEPNSDYSYIPSSIWRFVLEYNENKDAISATYTDSVNTIHTSVNTHYLRLTFYASSAKYFICNGSEPKLYEDYKVFIPSKYVENESVLPFFLPKHIYVANGRTVEIYYNQILLNADRYNIQATCPIGKALERKFQIIGDASHVGNTYTLSIVAYNDLGDVIVSGSSTIHIVANTISANKRILPVGDSLTNGKPWLSELHTLSANLTTIGTRQGVHEGRSGANVSTYTNVGGGIVYDYDNEYSDNTIPIFDSSASYNPGDKVKIAHTFGNGTSGYRYWVFKQAHSPGAFIESEAYCYSGGNPFYDYINEKFSMTFYQNFFGISYDVILLFLGTNGINLEPETNPKGALGIKNLIELIRVDEPTKPIIVVNTIFRSNQNGIGNQGNTDGYVAQSAYKFNEDKKVLLLAKAVDNLCGNMANVYLCPVGFTHDSKYNFGNNKVQVNPRLSSTDDVFELMPSDSVHPQTPGYMQMADEMFSTICAIVNS